MKVFGSLWDSLWGRPYGAVNSDGSQDCSENSPSKVALRAINEKCRSALVIAFIGVFGILSGLFIVFVDPYDYLFNWKTKFAPGGEIFEIWRAPTVDLYLRIYLWNVTNKDEFMSGAEDKLRLQEVGPYVYRELMSHENVTFNDNGTLTTIPKHPLVWVEELSEGNREDDLLILPNIALLSIADVVSEESYFTRFGMNVIIRRLHVEPLVQMTAREFMFGYKSELMTLGNNFMPSWIYFDKLGLIDRMYEFSGDYATVYTGEHDINKAGLLDTYTGSTRMPQWENPCGNIREASDGTKFKGNIQPEDKLLFFRKSMCRSKYLVKVNETISHNLNAYVYKFDPESDDNGKFNKNNTCFCKRPGRCLPPGLLDVRGCYYGFPIALSNPHFLKTDPSALSKVYPGTMKPDPAKHESFFVIQPRSGLPLELAARFQINMALGNIKNIAHVEKFDQMVLPLLWAEMRLFGLPDSLASRFKLYLNVLPVVVEILKYVSFFFGSLFLLWAMHRFRKSRSKKTVFNSPWIEDEFALNFERKLTSYQLEKKLGAKEKEAYSSSLAVPLNKDFSLNDSPEKIV